jgi:hypothetical protein
LSLYFYCFPLTLKRFIAIYFYCLPFREGAGGIEPLHPNFADSISLLQDAFDVELDDMAGNESSHYTIPSPASASGKQPRDPNQENNFGKGNDEKVETTTNNKKRKGGPSKPPRSKSKKATKGNSNDSFVGFTV